MKPPKRRIHWQKGRRQDDVKTLRGFQKGLYDEEVLCEQLRLRYYLGDWTDEEIMENVRWLGYGLPKHIADWRGY